MNYKYECVSEQGQRGLLWTVFEGAPFTSRRIASFSREADAREWLKSITLGPDLLEALEKIAAWQPDAAPIEPNGMSIVEAIDLARAAIAKAKGE